ncbi:hypothetical protein PV409_36805 [Streptomyces sp. ME02-6979.5a]|uniref:hypothetical protein n=1 Tax=Streptomyces sp. ME02-6979.5a TaxID=462925 RepID=UPI0029B597FB|nr:hypothetical protein [Streptomyces sp. ME02-6979.5a]MDX3343524.1 hypothetical protein [Streptomyces sp. ME02-6979.5a]
MNTALTAPQATGLEVRQAGVPDLDMDEVAAELYTALQYIESLQITPFPAVHTATPETENEQ